jgi:hypothetical protein
MSLRAPAFRTSGPGAHSLRRTELKPYVSPIERAFELAQTGRFTTVSEIRQRLRDEGYVTDSIVGLHLRNQLKSAIRETLTQQHKPQSEHVGESVW